MLTHTRRPRSRIWGAPRAITISATISIPVYAVSRHIRCGTKVKQTSAYGRGSAIPHARRVGFRDVWKCVILVSLLIRDVQPLSYFREYELPSEHAQGPSTGVHQQATRALRFIATNCVRCLGAPCVPGAIEACPSKRNLRPIYTTPLLVRQVWYASSST